MIRAQGILEEFPGRTEADLYLWIIEHQGYLRDTYGRELSLEEATELFKQEFTSGLEENSRKGRKGKKRKNGKS
jgi:hypothetical protein